MYLNISNCLIRRRAIQLIQSNIFNFYKYFSLQTTRLSDWQAFQCLYKVKSFTNRTYQFQISCFMFLVNRNTHANSVC